MARLAKLHIDTGEKAEDPVESLQWRRRPENGRFLSLVVVERVLTVSLKTLSALIKEIHAFLLN